MRSGIRQREYEQMNSEDAQQRGDVDQILENEELKATLNMPK